MLLTANKEETVAFTVVLIGNHEPVLNTSVPYNSVITNKGGHYDTDRNQFIAPNDGTYTFYVNTHARSSGCALDIYKNEERQVKTWSKSESDAMASNCVILELEDGDQVSVRAMQMEGCVLAGEVEYGGGQYNTFSGIRN